MSWPPITAAADQYIKPCVSEYYPIMDINFCTHYHGDGLPPTNRFCRNCPMAKVACDHLWSQVVALSQSNGGNAVRLPGTRAIMYPNVNNWNIIHLKINTKWGLPKEDFLHFIATGSAQMGKKRGTTG